MRRKQWENNTKPLLEGNDPTVPMSYIAHADHLFQYAARYGYNQVHDSLLKLADGQLNLSGLKYLKYYENWNEQNNWWNHRGEYFTPYEFAAMSSADYDGHLQELGSTVGIKNADSTARLVMSGLANLNIDYVRAVKFWADYNRNGSFPADVLNFHHYSSVRKNGKQRAIGPEQDSLHQKLSRLVAFRDKHLPTLEIWLTEFGYDTHPDSPQGTPKINTFSYEEVQAIWVIRSLLAVCRCRY